MKSVIQNMNVLRLKQFLTRAVDRSGNKYYLSICPGKICLDLIRIYNK